MLKLLNTEHPFPYGPSDFSDNSQWVAYRAAEVSTLSQMMLLMMQSNPSLTQSSDRHSNGDLSTRMDGLKLNGNSGSLNGIDNPFTYIPPDPRLAYRELLTRCLEWDLEVLKTLPEDEDVSLSVLSQEHVALLGECAMRWRLPASFRSWTFLEAIVDRCEQGLVPPACVHEATGMLARLSQEMSIDTWAAPDVSIDHRTRALPGISQQIFHNRPADSTQRDGLQAAFLRRDICLFSAVESALIHSQNGYHSPDFLEAVSDWLALDAQDVSHPSLQRAATSIVERARVQAYKSYINEASERFEFEGGKTRGFAMAMAGWVESQAKKLNKKFMEPIAE